MLEYVSAFGSEEGGEKFRIADLRMLNSREATPSRNTAGINPRGERFAGLWLAILA